MIKQSPLFIAILLTINVIAGFILPYYPLFNVIMTSVVLCAAIGFAFWTNKKKILPAYSFSLAFVMPLLTLVELMIGFISSGPSGIIAILLCLAIQLLLVHSVIRVSAKSA